MQEDGRSALRKMAAECAALAERTIDPEIRVSHLMIAQRWIAIANGRVAVNPLDEINQAPE